MKLHKYSGKWLLKKLSNFVLSFYIGGGSHETAGRERPAAGRAQETGNILDILTEFERQKVFQRLAKLKRQVTFQILKEFERQEVFRGWLNSRDR